MKPLRDYQEAAIERLRQSFIAGHKRPVLMAPTGAGKTRIAAEIVALAQRCGARRIAFCVPAIALIDQTVAAFWAEGLRDIGVMQADHRMTRASAAVQVCSAQTLARRHLPDVDLAIIDECHVAYAIYEQWIAARPDMPFVGLSATPWAKGMAQRFDDLVIAETTAGLIARGFLSPFKVYAPSHPDLTGIKTIAGDYHEGQLAERMNTAKLVGDVVETWQKLGENRPTLVFAVNCNHARSLQQKFAEAGIAAAYQDAETPAAERENIRKCFKDGRYQVVCNVGTLTTGVDWDVRCISLCRPTKSEILYVQIIGRGLRPADGKPDCLILDHSDTTARLGFVTDIHHDTLDDGTKKKAKKDELSPVKHCPRCSFVVERKTPVCPACGYQWAKPPVHEHGSLRPVEVRTAQEPRAGIIPLGGANIAPAAFYGELRAYALRKGYSPGWAMHKYREKVGAWPDRTWRSLPVAATVSPAVGRWIKAQAIAWARRKTG